MRSECEVVLTWLRFLTELLLVNKFETNEHPKENHNKSQKKKSTSNLVLMWKITMARVKWRRLSHGKQMGETLSYYCWSEPLTGPWSLITVTQHIFTHGCFTFSSNFSEIRSVVFCVKNGFVIIKNMVLGFKAVLFLFTVTLKSVCMCL